ncbi:MAG: translation initiation factor IF-3 [Desulfobacterota bacterium]|nr:translation initiation factor IF-3 [Thermodesulfobacteriota bacterium]
MRVNAAIRVPQVRVIDAEGKQIGILETRKAIELANDQGYDLVEVSPNAQPPVCRFMDYGKYKYQQSKKLQKQKAQHQIHIKEIKVRPFTGEHDLEVKLRHILEFLEKGDKVKITLMFRGRELQYKEHGEAMLKRIIEAIGDHGVIEKDMKFEGRNMVLMVGPQKQQKQKPSSDT